MNDKATGAPVMANPHFPDDLPTHSPDGVDLTLIRWMLSLTPAQRLEALQGFVESVVNMRGGRFNS